MNPTEFIPRLIAWEVTRRCNLKCRHCRASATGAEYAGELSTEECRRVMDNIASFAHPIVILTGGEPMLRPDILEIAKYGNELGLRMVMAPCGQMINEESVCKMRSAGIQRISLSIDGASAASHDAFRGVDGAFDSVIAAAKCARAGRLEFQVNTTITRKNVGEIGAILDLAIDLGAVAYHPFLLVPTGRGRDLMDQELPAEEYERVLEWIHEKSKTAPIAFKPTCAPHFYRIIRQKGSNGNGASGHGGLDAMSRGCMGGSAFAFISHVGKVQICGFLEQEAGDLRAVDFDFKQVWNHSPLFQEVRDVDNYKGKCGYCEYRKICGGCRARAFAIHGDPLRKSRFAFMSLHRAKDGNIGSCLESSLQASSSFKVQP